MQKALVIPSLSSNTHPMVSPQCSCVTFHTLVQHDQINFCPPILELTLRLKLKHGRQDLENCYVFPVMKYVHLYVTPPPNKKKKN